ncbi:MAG: HAD-IC family P-type ATPase [Alloprevotella sp.]|nr:HAD-IC family P-type ATPase [Alloprevotella sp.]
MCKCCDTCGCGHGAAHHHEGNAGETHRLWAPALAFLLLITGLTLDHTGGWPQGWMRPALYLLSYALVGLPVLREAGEELLHGDVFNEFLLMGIATIGAICLGEYPEAVSVMLLYRIGEWFQDRAVGRANRDIKALVDLRPDHARVQSGGTWREVAPSEVAVGDVIAVGRGDRVPLDGILLSTTARFDTAALTGESEERTFTAGGEVLAGMINTGEEVRLRIVRPSEESALSRIMRMVSEAESRKAPTELFIRRFARIYTPAVIALAVLVAILPALRGDGEGLADYIYRACTFLVISCPCALVISIPLGYYSGIGLASRKGVLFKGGHALDRIAGVDTAVFDKTGTLTVGTELRPDAQQAIRTLRDVGGVTRVEMLSGDRREVVERVAQAVGMDAWQAELLPEGKVRRVEELREQGRRVAFVGDGVNDAPVLAVADVGIAMGGVGTDAAVETADIVLQTDRPERVATAIRISRLTRRVVWLNIGLALGVKLAVLALGALGIASMWLAVFADTGVALWCVANIFLFMRLAGRRL